MQILTKNTIKEIRALEQRKGRKEQHAWLAEGNRMVDDLLVSDAFACRRLVATCDWWEAHPELAQIAAECYQVTPTEMQRVSLQQAPQWTGILPTRSRMLPWSMFSFRQRTEKLRSYHP